jgi:uncharacterized membrane protein
MDKQIEIIIFYAFFLAEMSDIECSNSMSKFKAKLNYHIMIAIVSKLSLKKMHLHLTF